MRVAIDTNPLYVTQAGVSRYVRGLKKGLAQVASPDLTFFDFAWPVSNFGYRQPQRALKTIYRELIWPSFSASRFLQDKKIDMLHTTGGILLMPPRPIRHVVTLYDLAVMRHPERFRRWHRISTKHRLSKLLTADRIACISRFTADEAIQLLGIPAKKLDVVYLGNDFHVDEFPAEKTPEFPVPNEFFLFVGSLEPGKNLSLLREVYSLAASIGKELPSLLIIGARWEGVGREGTPPKNWHYLGRVPDGILIYLYRRAIALAFPSKYEGFGFPIVEAMGLGCPVICSRVASIPEVAGEAACFADLTPNSYFEAMRLLIENANLRQELISKGHCRAKDFSWKKCATETLQVYQQAFE